MSESCCCGTGCIGSDLGISQANCHVCIHRGKKKSIILCQLSAVSAWKSCSSNYKNTVLASCSSQRILNIRDLIFPTRTCLPVGTLPLILLCIFSVAAVWGSHRHCKRRGRRKLFNHRLVRAAAVHMPFSTASLRFSVLPKALPSGWAFATIHFLFPRSEGLFGLFAYSLCWSSCIAEY